jgi:hypothetical protein
MTERAGGIRLSGQPGSRQPGGRQPGKALMTNVAISPQTRLT